MRKFIWVSVLQIVVEVNLWISFSSVTSQPEYLSSSLVMKNWARSSPALSPAAAVWPNSRRRLFWLPSFSLALFVRAWPVLRARVLVNCKRRRV